MLNRKILGYSMTLLMLMVALAAIPTVKTQEGHRFFTAVITPTIASCGETVTYTMTICNDPSTPNDAQNYIGSVEIHSLVDLQGQR